MTAPRSTAAFLTERCQNRCRFCFEWSAQPRGYVMERTFFEAQLARLKAQGCKSVDLVGGEPFLHPEFEALAAAVRAQGLRLTVTTNGLRLADPAFARRVLPLLDGLVVSIHAGDPETYSALTRNPDGFQALKRALAVVRRRPRRLRLLFNTTVTQPALPTLRGILGLLAGLAPTTWDVTNPFPVGAAREAYLQLAPRLSEVSRRAGSLVEEARRAGIAARFSFFPTCAIDYRVDLNNDLKEPGHAGGYRVDHELNPAHRADLTFTRGFGDVCQSCRLKDESRCFGVPEAYLEHFGDEELKPVDEATYERIVRLAQ